MTVLRARWKIASCIWQWSGNHGACSRLVLINRREYSSHCGHALQSKMQQPTPRCSGLMPPAIAVDKSSALVDETIAIRVSGVKPFSLVTIVAEVSDKARYYSYATYRADHEGLVNLSLADAIAGTYTGKEPMGLIWSMTQQPGQPEGRRLMKLDVTSPLVTTFSLYPGQIDGSSALEKHFQESNRLSTVTCERWYMDKGVKRIPVQEGRLRGTLFLPAGDGPFPGTVDMFGTAGGTIEYRSALLASRGIASLALCYFLPDLVKDLEYFESAVDFLLSQRQVSQSGVAAIGVSKGSDLALLLSIISPKVRASINICGTAWVSVEDHTFRGETFPHFRRMYEQFTKMSEESKPGEKIWLRPIMESSSVQQHLMNNLPIERSENAHYLVIHGEDDQCVPPSHATAIVDRLKANGKNNFTLAMYPEAGHLIEPPYGHLTHTSFHNFFRALCVWGGTPKYHARAQEDSWRRIQQFIHERIPIT